MNTFMGPMTPPPASPGQPQKLDIRTNPNQRAGFKKFMRQRTAPAVMPIQQMPQAQPMPMPMMQPRPQMPLRMQMGGGVDIFDPMYSAPMMAPPAPMGFDDGGSVPPRRTEIAGQPHMLSYITPDEADILEALGGAGEAGPMGIPAFYDEGRDEGDQAASATGEQGDPSDPGFDDPGGDDKQQQRYEEDAQRRRDDARAALERSIAAENAREAEAARQRSRALDQARRAQDRVQAGLAREELATSVGVSRPDVNVTATSSPGLSESTIDPVGDPDDDTDAGGIETTDLLGADDLLNLDPKDFTPTAPATAAEKAQAAADARAAGIGMDDEYDDVVGTPDYDDPNRQGYRDGLPTSMIDGEEVGFFDDPANFVSTPRGLKVTSRLGGLTAAQKAAMPGYMNPKEIDPVTGEVTGNRKGFAADVMNTLGINPMEDPLGFEIDPTTGRVTGIVNEPDLPGTLGAALDVFTDIFFDDPSTFTSDRQLFTDRPSVYTGFGEGSRIGFDDQGKGPDPVKQPFDPCPEGFVLKDGVCTPIQQADTGDGTPNQIGGGPDQPPPVPGGPVVVPSTRPTGPFNLQGPVGYGVPTAGQADPSVATNAALYQQMLNQQAAAPIRLQSGGPVSSNLDRAADNFLKSLMPTA
jgi:hypothetical protein